MRFCKVLQMFCWVSGFAMRFDSTLRPDFENALLFSKRRIDVGMDKGAV